MKESSAPETEVILGLMTELDPLDYRILEHVQRDVLQPAHEIGETIGLSAASVQRRIKKMRKWGVIASVTANVDPHRIGLSVTCIVSVTLAADGTQPVDRLKSIFVDHHQVQQCYYITGSADFTLIVVAQDMEDYDGSVGPGDGELLIGIEKGLGNQLG